MIWGDDGIQLARLICELVANNDLELQSVAESMDLEMERVLELFERAHILWEDAKLGELDHADRVEQVVTTCAVYASSGEQVEVAGTLRSLADTLDGGEA